MLTLYATAGAHYALSNELLNHTSEKDGHIVETRPNDPVYATYGIAPWHQYDDRWVYSTKDAIPLMWKKGRSVLAQAHQDFESR